MCLGSIVVQGYSLTESTCTGTVMENCDLSTGTVGKPMTGIVYDDHLFIFIFFLKFLKLFFQTLFSTLMYNPPLA